MNLDIVRTWKQVLDRTPLSREEPTRLSAPPIGVHELSEEELGEVVGGGHHHHHHRHHSHHDDD
jgi:mersacidin/lichenicidin family type 2 lantibiotic